MADEKKPTEATKKAEPAKRPAPQVNNEVEELKKKLAEAEKAKADAEAIAKKAEEAKVKAEQDAEKAIEEATKKAEPAKAEEVEEAVVAKKVKLIRVKFMDEHTMYHQGKSKTFPKGAEAEVDQYIANKLFQRKIAMVIG